MEDRTHTEPLARCDHCSITLDVHDCGPAEHAARWRDADGDLDADVSYVCADCLAAGAPGGPGYELVDTDET